MDRQLLVYKARSIKFSLTTGERIREIMMEGRGERESRERRKGRQKRLEGREGRVGDSGWISKSPRCFSGTRSISFLTPIIHKQNFTRLRSSISYEAHTKT